MTIAINFTYEHRYQGVHVADVDAIAWIETHAPFSDDDWSISRIVFCSVGEDHQVDVIGEDRKAVEKYLVNHRGYSEDIAEAVRDANNGRFIRDRQTAMAERVGR